VTAIIFDKNGEITIFLSLLLSAVLSFVLIVFRSAANYSVKFQDEVSMDAALRSCFGEYHQELYERYHLLYIDSSYRVSTADKENVEDHIYTYMLENLDFEKEFGGEDFFNIQLGETTINKYLLSSDMNALPVYIQATEYLINYGEREHANRIMELRSELPYSDRDTLFGEWDGILEYVASFGVDFVNPSAIARGMAGEGENQIMGVRTLRNNRTSYADIPSKRTLKEGNFGAITAQERELIFTEYLCQNCGSSIHPMDKSVMSGEMEYLLCGNESDEENTKTILARLIRIFAGESLSYISENGGMISEIREYADEIVPPPSSDPENQMYGVDRKSLVNAVAESLRFAWAECEAILKADRLFGGGQVIPNNPSEGWMLPLRSVTAYRSMLGGGGGNGFSYEEYIASFFNEVDRKIICLRFLDIVEMNMRKSGSNGFCVDGCIEYLKASAQTNSSFGKEYIITRDFSYEQRYRIADEMP